MLIWKQFHSGGLEHLKPQKLQETRQVIEIYKATEEKHHIPGIHEGE